jgi:aerobic-type carbon monoxide dehydrogenase small subunit (CoxS/CutS family)
MFELKINGRTHHVDVEPDTPLLWVVREQLGMTGTKFGCGIGACGACTMHLNGMAMRTCILPVAAAVGSELTTIEGLDHAVKQAWLTEQVPQCGYCQSGQLMAAASLLARNPEPTDADIERAMTNLCRCGTYDGIRKGIHAAARELARLRAAEEAEAKAEPAAETEDAPDVDGGTE